MVYAVQPPMVGLAVASLVCGIAGWLIPCLFGVPGIAAVVCGHMALQRLKQQPQLRGRGQAIAGLILGYPGAVVVAILAISYVIGSLAQPS